MKTICVKKNIWRYLPILFISTSNLAFAWTAMESSDQEHHKNMAAKIASLPEIERNQFLESAARSAAESVCLGSAITAKCEEGLEFWFNLALHVGRPGASPEIPSLAYAAARKRCDVYFLVDKNQALCKVEALTIIDNAINISTRSLVLAQRQAQQKAEREQQRAEERNKILSEKINEMESVIKKLESSQSAPPPTSSPAPTRPVPAAQAPAQPPPADGCVKGPGGNRMPRYELWRNTCSRKVIVSFKQTCSNGQVTTQTRYLTPGAETELDILMNSQCQPLQGYSFSWGIESQRFE